MSERSGLSECFGLEARRQTRKVGEVIAVRGKGKRWDLRLMVLIIGSATILFQNEMILNETDRFSYHACPKQKDKSREGSRQYQYEKRNYKITGQFFSLKKYYSYHLYRFTLFKSTRNKEESLSSRRKVKQKEKKAKKLGTVIVDKSHGLFVGSSWLLLALVQSLSLKVYEKVREVFKQRIIVPLLKKNFRTAFGRSRNPRRLCPSKGNDREIGLPRDHLRARRKLYPTCFR